MANLNKVFLIGNLTRDPELRATQGGVNVCKFGLAVNRRYTTQQGPQEETTFVDLTAFGRQAEVIQQYCTKGKPIFVEGRLQFSS
ncbi:MAG TPA: single-stranded DNA-binding protein [Planctomycetota bacterium]|nr:single-stranded DNA-binding protein [Planctomycetota bacterium]